MDRDSWINQVFTPFDQGRRESFFLSAASFLFTNQRPELNDGYYLEFGTHKGRTMRHCWTHTRHNFNFTYVGFDSFEGLPEISPDDAHPGWERGSFAISEASFIKTVTDAGMPQDRLMTVPGFYDDTLTDKLAASLLPRKATIIYVDCDLYKSTVPVLRFIRPFLQPGTLIAFDDWNCFCADPDKGQRRAWREFSQQAPEMQFESFYSTHMMQAFVCVRS